MLRHRPAYPAGDPGVAFTQSRERLAPGEGRGGRSEEISAVKCRRGETGCGYRDYFYLCSIEYTGEETVVGPDKAVLPRAECQLVLGCA